MEQKKKEPRKDFLGQYYAKSTFSSPRITSDKSNYRQLSKDELEREAIKKTELKAIELSRKLYRIHLAKIYACSTTLFLIIVTQWTLLLYFFKDLDKFLNNLIVYQVVGIFFGFYLLLGLLTFTKRFQKCSPLFLWIYVFITIELNSVTQAKVLRYTKFPEYYLVLVAFACFYVLSLSLALCSTSRLALNLCVHDMKFACTAPMRVHIVSTMLGLCSSKHLKYLNLVLSLCMVFVNFMFHLMFSASIGNPKKFVKEKNGHLLLTVMNTLGMWAFYAMLLWFLEEMRIF